MLSTKNAMLLSHARYVTLSCIFYSNFLPKLPQLLSEMRSTANLYDIKNKYLSLPCEYPCIIQYSSVNI